jgi:quercetin dioxygenase-like cupin family protein
MSTTKTFCGILLLILSLILIGCTTVRYYPVNFIESLQHPTKFPEVFSSNVQNIEEIANKNPLGDNEDVKITNVGENKNSSMHLVQIRENGELHPHYHKRHDEVIYVKKGSGIATLDGTRYLIKSGSILQIPSKTVHKFLNTGGEPFMAVSIFSPPFDGRDEKSIKQKKKPDRGVKNEKRLAMKKSEKATEINQASSEKELTDEELKTSVAKSQAVGEQKLNKSVQEEWNSYTGEKPLPSKKKSKGVITDEEPAINIEDLHEKLTKLSELKEEGVISAEEYEGKKDALVAGKDIGELPELKSPAKKKTPLEDEPDLHQAEEHSSMDKDIADEGRDSMLSTPDLSDERETTVREIASEEREYSSENKLKALEEMKQEGLITEEDYENKKKKIAVITGEESISRMSKSITKDERVKELKDLYDQKLITEDDYKNKLEELTAAQTKNLSSDEVKEVSLTSGSIVEDERVKDLKELYDQGFVTEDDYQYKLKELIGAETKSQSSDISAEKGTENEKLLELNELKEEGFITEEDYESKKAQLQGH